MEPESVVHVTAKLLSEGSHGSVGDRGRARWTKWTKRRRLVEIAFALEPGLAAILPDWPRSFEIALTQRRRVRAPPELARLATKPPASGPPAARNSAIPRRRLAD